MDSDANPWAISSIEDCVFYCCPECEDKSFTKSTFINHAWDSHHEARSILQELEPTYFDDAGVIKRDVFDQGPDTKDGFQLGLNEPPEAAPDIFVPEDVKDEMDISETVIEENSIEDFCETVLKLEAESDNENSPLILTHPPKGNKTKRKAKAKSDNAEDKADKKQRSRKTKTVNGEERPKKKRGPKPKKVKVDNKAMVPCPVCGNVIKRISMTNHIRLMHKDPPAQCDICKKMYKTSTHVAQHKRLVHSEKTFPCNQCEMVFKAMRNLKCHIKQFHQQKKDYLCPDCGKGFYNEFKLKLHMSSMHLKLTVVCDICGDSTKNLYNHKYLKHKILSRSKDGEDGPASVPVKGKCDNCDTTFPTAAELNDHQVTTGHHSGVVYECCDTNWVSPAAIRKHNHEEHNTYIFACPQCPVLKCSRTTINTHINNVHKKLRFSCDLCPKTFASKAAYKVHIAKPHDGSKETFPCTLCDRVALTRRELYNHTRKDHEKTVQCPHCDHKTVNQKILSVHISKHHSLRPFNCQHCPKAFTSNIKLSDHVAAFHNTLNSESERKTIL